MNDFDFTNMKIALITQNIKDPTNYAGAWLRQLQTIYASKLDITVFSNGITPLQNLLPESIVNYQDAFTSSFLESPFICQATQNNIRKQINVSKKLGRKTSAQVLIIEHLQLLRFYHHHFTSSKFDLLLVWNGITHSFQTAGVEIARNLNIPVVFLERGLIPGSIFYDFEGVNAESSIGKNPLWQQQGHLLTHPQLFSKIKELIIETGGGLVADSGQTSRITLEDYVFFPLQRDTDSNMLFNSPYVKNMFSILSSLNGWISQYQKKIPILIRPHPEDPRNHYTKHLVFDNLTIQSDGGLLETIEKSAQVMTVNSTVGFTSLILDKPVIALGKSVYNGRSLCAEPTNMDELRTILFNRHILSVNKEMSIKRQDFVSKVIANSHISFQHPDLLDIQTQALKQQLETVLNCRHQEL
jgi:hypothetical protein